MPALYSQPSGKLYLSPAYPDLNRVIFWDDFLHYLYNTRLWTNSSLTAVTTQTGVGGRILLHAHANVTGFLALGNAYFSSAKNMKMHVRCKMIPATAAGGATRVGFGGSILYWEYQPAASSYFRCVANYGGTVTTDSNVAGDGNDHVFSIETVGETYALFSLDGVPKVTITSNVTPLTTTPQLRCIGSAAGVSDINVDYVYAECDR